MKQTVKALFKKWLRIDSNENSRQQWLLQTLRAIPPGLRLLDAGAGELRNRPLCSHLIYVSQDACQYEGKGDNKGLQTGAWDTSQIDLVCDILNIPEPDASFDAILCSEVFEHLPDAVKALDEFERLLKPGGILITTAPFASLVHFAPYHFATGFSRYWYEYHLPAKHFSIRELRANGDWFAMTRQEILRMPRMARQYGDRCWPLAYMLAGMGLVYFAIRGRTRSAEDMSCFGWHCVAIKQQRLSAPPNHLRPQFR
jgi:SAM-dependent methyltransferase